MAVAVVMTVMGGMFRGQIAVGVVHRDLIAASPVHDPWLVGALLVDRLRLAAGTPEAEPGCRDLASARPAALRAGLRQVQFSNDVLTFGGS